MQKIHIAFAVFGMMFIEFIYENKPIELYFRVNKYSGILRGLVYFQHQR